MVGAIIQARMTSTRLPGKVMMEICGRPMIDHLLERLSLCKKIQIIVLATTTNREDDPLADHVQKKRIPLYRGSEQDVLDRYYQAARQFGVTDIMRITADCPLLDPEICDRLIGAYFNEKVDYIVTAQTFAEGLDGEVFSFEILGKAWKEARLKTERDHVTQYFHNHKNIFKMSILQNDTDDSKYRFTVDEENDFLVVKAILEEFASLGNRRYKTADIKKFLDTHPDVFSLNAHIIRNEGLQKSLKEDGPVEQ